MKKIKVYIASPYTLGWQPDNVRRQLEAKHILLDYGFIPFAPLENHFSEIHRHRDDNEWFEWDLEWLKVCDVLIRIKPIIEGQELKSTGSDIEQQTAIDENILVYTFNSLKELEKWCKKSKKQLIWDVCNEIKDTDE